ncbi:Phosphotransferase enzyme family domain containing protein [Rhypophila sp. PSN 637]
MTTRLQHTRNKPSRDGLIWDDTGLDLEPRWGREPDIEAIERVCRRHLNVPADEPQDESPNCTVTFHAAGTFNKMYLVEAVTTSPRKTKRRIKYMMRISLPVEPRNKTRGEVTTLQLVRQRTDIPVPEVVAFDDTPDNEIGFEWILLEFLPGRPAYYRWRKMSMARKEMLVARVADFQAQLSRLGNLGQGFRGIGTLGSTCTDQDRADLDDGSGLPGPGQVVSPVFFSGAHYHYPIPRGPFRSSHDWLQAYLNVIIKEHTTMLADTRDEDDREYAEAALRVARKLLRLLHRILPSLLHPPERTVLWHDELSLMNIMVDDNYKISGIIDWECVSTMPLWVASQFPEFLRGADRDAKPDRNKYTDVSDGTISDDDDDDDDDDGEPRNLEDSVDNEGKTELYWIHLMEYEQTQLRKVYSTRMRQLRPTWDVEVVEAAFKVDFLGAVSRCGAGFYLRRIEQWVDSIDRKEFLGLMEVLRVGIRKDKGASTSNK